MLLLYMVIIAIITALNNPFLISGIYDMLSPQIEINESFEDFIKIMMPSRLKVSLLAGFGFGMRVIIITVLSYICNIAIEKMKNISIKDWFQIITNGMMVFVISSIAQCIINYITNRDNSILFSQYTSLLFVSRWFENINPTSMAYLPLSLVNIFNISFVFYVSIMHSKKSGSLSSDSFKFCSIIFTSCLLCFVIIYNYLLFIYR